MESPFDSNRTASDVDLESTPAPSASPTTRPSNGNGSSPDNGLHHVGFDSQPEVQVTGSEKIVVARSSSGIIGGAFWFLATVALVLAAWWIGPLAVEKYQYASTRGRVQAEYENAVKILQNAPLDDVSMAYQLVAQRIRPSVVSVQAGVLGRMGTIEFVSGGQGSGVLMSNEGYILTNHHVLQNAEYVEVTLHDRRQFSAEIVGTDELTDLAVIKIDAPDLIAAEWGDSDALRVGSMVWAVGSPYGLDQTVTSGILSAKDRNGRESYYQEFLQTDAAVNPGNSGGPLVNAAGQVVGINTSIYGEKFQGISFAIPSSVSRHVFEQIRSNGKVSRGFLGVTPRPVFHDDKTTLSLPDLDGAIIRSIATNGPAAESQLRENDVIRCWNGNPIKRHTNLYRYIGMTAPDTVATADIIRNGREMSIEVPVGDRSRFRFR